MKIAIATMQGQVCEHFGYCELFTVYDVENEQIVKKTTLTNPGHRPGFLPAFLSEYGVNVIIAGGMGSGAVDLFNEKHIAIITGASGDVDPVINKWISRELKSSGSVCNEHQHHSDC
jgi:predicted Fe-Mo cluster-binding NifX family protein